MGESLLLHELRDDDTSFLVAVALPVEVPAALQRVPYEGPVVGRPVGDDHVGTAEGLGHVLLEAVRHGEDDDLQYSLFFVIFKTTTYSCEFS